jgi:hypothetical protein
MKVEKIELLSKYRALKCVFLQGSHKQLSQKALNQEKMNTININSNVCEKQ